MTILYHISYPNGLGADRWIYEGWRNAFEDLGHKVYTVRDGKEISDLAEKIKPDLLMTYASLWDFNNWVFARPLVLRRPNIVMFIDNVILKNSNFIKLVKEGNLADLYFGERSEEAMADFEKLTGKKYYLIPNAADKTVYFPTQPVKKYKCDICFVGAYLPKKKKVFKKIIFPLLKKYDVRIYGPYWTWKDLFLLAGNKLFRRLKFYLVADFLNKQRLILSAEEENKLYSSTKICLNIHERDVNGRDYDLVNQRTFKIPLCGGFQICDKVESLKKFFSEDEVIMVDDSEWLEKIDYYLTHEKERKKIQEKGTERALKEHTYHNRVEQLLNLIKFSHLV